MSDFFSGLLPNSDAGQAWLDSVAVDVPNVVGDSGVPEQRFAAPPVSLVRTENQGPVNSCSGFMLSTAIEADIAMLTGEKIQLSPMFAYLMNQQRDGIRGDAGATISAAAWVAMNIGVCREDLFPYTGQYTTQIPAGCREDAANYKAGAVARCRNYDDVYRALRFNMGRLLTGQRWPLPMQGIDVWTYQGAGRGGHATAGVCLSDLVDEDGRPWPWINNSHGAQFGQSGWYRIHPRVVDAICDDVFGVYVISKTRELKPKNVNYLANNPYDAAQWAKLQGAS